MSCSAGPPGLWLAASLAVTLISAAGCNRSKSPAPKTAPHLAVLRCENLSADPSADWMGRAISEIITNDLATGTGMQVMSLTGLRSAGSGIRPASAPGISTEREAALLGGADRILACEYNVTGGVVSLSAQLEDMVTLTMLQRTQAQGTVLAAADAVARQISPQARAFSSRNADALRAYADGLDAADPAASAAALERAIQADPNFAPAYMAWASAELQRKDRAAAQHVLELAKARGDAIPAYERAKVALGDAELRGDQNAKVQALSNLAKSGPPDPTVYRGLADAALQGRRYREAIAAYEKALSVTPEDIALLNSLGYAYAYLGDLDHALETLRKYEKLQPKQANPIDSQADVNFYMGKYAEAEKLYLAANDKDPSFLGGAELLKASQARLATGDIPAADALFQRYIAGVEARHDPLATYRKAQWKYLSGRRREAIAMLGADANVQSQAQTAFWELAMGIPNAADRLAKARAQLKIAPPLILLVASILAQPPAPASEWEARATRFFGQSTLRDQCAAYGLILGKDFKSALPYVKRAWEQTHPNNEEGLPVVLAWTMLESGQAEGATSLLGPTPIPQAAGPGPLATFYFPRIFYLRALNFDRMGKHDQALESYRLFLKLAGNDPEIWGEENRARKAVGQ